MNKIAFTRHPADSVAFHDSVNWAISRLTEVCGLHNIRVVDAGGSAEMAEADLEILIAGRESEPLGHLLEMNGAVLPEAPESLCVFSNCIPEQPKLVLSGSDVRGLVYALLDLADTIKYAQDPTAALRELRAAAPRSEKPASPVRGINRLFVSEVEDKPWFYNRSFWREYLTELATNRFNRFHLALGMGYDYGHDPGVRDNYFCFAYPYLLSVPGYEIHVRNLPDGEAEKNLAALRFISEEASLRGIDFHLGIWTHAYDPSDSPDANYIIEGVGPDNHAVYCRDALRTLLEVCPAISGVTIRTHYEGGIPEPAHEFWQTVLSGIPQCGRLVEIDLHSKGVDDRMLQVALETGMPVVISPKYWAEHMGPPYHQAAIRKSELPTGDTDRPDLMAITATYRRFTRYGYADFLKEERNYGVLFRIWPGTQRVLLWGDPAMAAGYGRASSFCGALGTELCEPLTFKARKGSGSLGGRDPYADASLRPEGGEWKKYLYTYRLWGRLLYNPDSDPQVWRRYLKAEFGAGALACEEALAQASRILPLLTSAHLPSAANNSFWPEMYANMAIVPSGKRKHPYGDTPEPKTFGAVSPLDPALFYRIDDFADDVLASRRSGKYSPIDVARCLSGFAEEAERSMAAAATQVRSTDSPAFRRLALDVSVLANLGRFFSHKLRAGTAYAIFERTQDTDLLKEAVTSYRSARDAWIRIVEATNEAYNEDITFGYVSYMRGNWSDRLAAIEEDLSAMERELASAHSAAASAGRETASALAKLGDSPETKPAWQHHSPGAYLRGQSLVLSFLLTGNVTSNEVQVLLHYRHANHAGSYVTAEMKREGMHYTAAIPEAYTDTRYPIVYYFEIQNNAGNAWLAPGFNETFSNQPYYVLRQR